MNRFGNKQNCVLVRIQHVKAGMGRPTKPAFSGTQLSVNMHYMLGMKNSD